MYILYILYHEYKTSYEYKKVYQCYKHEFKVHSFCIIKLYVNIKKYFRKKNDLSSEADWNCFSLYIWKFLVQMKTFFAIYKQFSFEIFYWLYTLSEKKKTSFFLWKSSLISHCLWMIEFYFVQIKKNIYIYKWSIYYFILAKLKKKICNE